MSTEATNSFPMPPLSGGFKQQPEQDMRLENSRLKTLNSNLGLEASIRAIAKSGFYYNTLRGLLLCHFCRYEIEPGQAVGTTLMHNPNCPLNLGMPSGNVAMLDRDECGIFSENSHQHPEYTLESTRLKTFRHWPARMRQSPKDLADAGFFYTGQGDQTICFSCGGGLKDWDDDDIPWEQHAQWFDKCEYLLKVKGVGYVKEICMKNSGEMRHEPEVLTQAAVDNPEDSKMCGICIENERDVCFLPCGHVYSCAKCSIPLKHCPVCRVELIKAVRMYYT